MVVLLPCVALTCGGVIQCFSVDLGPSLSTLDGDIVFPWVLLSSGKMSLLSGGEVMSTSVAFSALLGL
jgi:hypothetical protein